MLTVDKFEKEWTWLQREFPYGSYGYCDPLSDFSSITNAHFKKTQEQERYGVYIIYQRDTRRVLYIGKSGTITTQGEFKGQDIPGRLTNVRGKKNGKDIPANQ